jgi:hypothetical protein
MLVCLRCVVERNAAEPDRWDRETPPRCAEWGGQWSRLYWSDGWGWGVQTSLNDGMHHRYSECDGGARKPDGSACYTGGDKIHQFTYVRDGYASGDSPEVTCVEYE